MLNWIFKLQIYIFLIKSIISNIDINNKQKISYNKQNIVFYCIS